jgi:hypothetical protein
MSVRVLIPRHLARHVDNKSQLDLEASDLKTALEVLSRQYQLKDILLTREGHLQAFIRIVIDEGLVMSRRAEDLQQIPVSGRTVEIQSGFAGG